tara:strand:+ start:330 stop:503 length:174 start_codon:yes stop_codon:yes gene_type:complete
VGAVSTYPAARVGVCEHGRQRGEGGSGYVVDEADAGEGQAVVVLVRVRARARVRVRP